MYNLLPVHVGFSPSHRSTGKYAEVAQLFSFRVSDPSRILAHRSGSDPQHLDLEIVILL
jgi:hypothetical protein